MKIIEPSATIIENELAALSVAQRIDTTASVCYQRPPKPTEDEAQAFCRKMINSGHFATLELAVDHLVTDPWNQVESKFVLVSPAANGKVIMSGSIRAFMESEGEYGSRVWNFLAQELPLFFAESDAPKTDDVRFARQEEIPDAHKHVAARFIVNRVVSHELVRHRPCSFLQESQRFCRYDDEVVFISPSAFFTDDANGVDFAHWRQACEYAEQMYLKLRKNGQSPQAARTVLPNSCKTEVILYASLQQWRHILSLRTGRAADPSMRQVMIPLAEEFGARWPAFFGYQKKYPDQTETKQ